MRHILLLYNKFDKLVKYLAIGCVGAGLDFLLFSVFVSGLGIYFQTANVFSTLCGITANFLLNAYFNFKTKSHLFLRFLSFLSVGCLGILITALILNLLINHLGINPLTAKIIAIFIIPMVQFTLNKYITFRSRHV